ncbi:MAG TPA: GNAT family N-acetyltransferase [Flavisolibacter sp.]|nr:GNAT family N-acetyltransferase [Flavisolibacter sp.]
MSNRNELVQILELNHQNLKQNLSDAEQQDEGFITWLYSLELLEKMHDVAPSVIVKDGDKIVGYALTTPIEARSFHPDLDIMFQNLEPVQYKNAPLFSFRFYCMGQICVDKNYRGKGVVNLLYQKHKELFAGQYEFILTEISTRNKRSIKAHEKVGFTSIYQYSDATDDWSVVIWDWK